MVFEGLTGIGNALEREITNNLNKQWILVCTVLNYILCVFVLQTAEQKSVEAYSRSALYKHAKPLPTVSMLQYTFTLLLLLILLLLIFVLK